MKNVLDYFTLPCFVSAFLLYCVGCVCVCGCGCKVRRRCWKRERSQKSRQRQPNVVCADPSSDSRLTPAFDSTLVSTLNAEVEPVVGRSIGDGFWGSTPTPPSELPLSLNDSSNRHAKVVWDSHITKDDSRLVRIRSSSLISNRMDFPIVVRLMTDSYPNALYEPESNVYPGHRVTGGDRDGDKGEGEKEGEGGSINASQSPTPPLAVPRIAALGVNYFDIGPLGENQTMCVPLVMANSLASVMVRPATAIEAGPQGLGALSSQGFYTLKKIEVVYHKLVYRFVKIHKLVYRFVKIQY